jgi:hypothetical protein
MALEIYRSGNKDSMGFDRYMEICRECASNEVKNGYYVEYDTYLSERTDAVTRECTCQMCYESFFIDGRRKLEPLEGVVY